MQCYIRWLLLRHQQKPVYQCSGSGSGLGLAAPNCPAALGDYCCCATVSPEERYRKCSLIPILLRKALAIHHVSWLFTIRGHCPAGDITISYIAL